MELLKDFVSFSWAVINNWAGYSTGGLIVALVALWSMLRQTTMGRNLGILLAILFLVMAVFSAWKDKKKEADAKSAEILLLNEQISNLTASSISADIDYAILGQESSGSHAGIIVSLRNQGAASAITPSTWRLTALVDNGNFSEGYPITLKDKDLDFCLSPDRLMRFVRADALYLKASIPIARNGYEQGFLWFSLPDLDKRLLIEPTTILSLSATSVTGQQINTSISIAELIKRSRSTRFFSGIANPTSLDIPCKENQRY